MLPYIQTDLNSQVREDLPTRFGTPIEKGIKLSQSKLETIEEELKAKFEIWSAYPDVWIEEVLVPTASNFKLKFYQTIMARNLARCSYNHITAARGVSKTYTVFLMFFHGCIFMPGSTYAFAAPSKTQSAQIANQTVTDLLETFPILKLELDGDIKKGKDYFLIDFKNGSSIEITAALETTRGRRFMGIGVDETRDHDGNLVNGILVPTVSKMRTTAGTGQLNPYEKRQIQCYTTSASEKSSYNYEKALDLFQRMIIAPQNSSIMGLDYRIPVKEGIYPASFVQDIKSDSTMTEQLFAREYLSIYTSESESSWFNFTKLNKHRKRINAEWKAQKSSSDIEFFYIISVDIGRIKDSTIATVFKVYPKPDAFRAVVVNIFPLGKTQQDKAFAKQAMDIKTLISEFNPKQVIIDINGLGIAIADLMTQEQIDAFGNKYPAYGFINQDEYKKTQPSDAPKILYGFKANSKLNSEMFGNCYQRIDRGLVDFLIKEQTARSKLLATKKGQKMSVFQKTKVLMPYEMTTKLFNEMGNLRLKRTGSGTDIVLEPINSRFPDDKFSSLCLGLYLIKQLELEDSAKRKKRSGKKRTLAYFT